MKHNPRSSKEKNIQKSDNLGFQVRFFRQGKEYNRYFSFKTWGGEKEALEALPYFTELCGGRTWDMSGRLYQRGGHPPEENLTVPNVKWISDTRVLVYGG